MIALTLLMVQALLPASSPDLADANAAFQRGDYAVARQAYHRTLADGWASEALYYNLGTTYVRMDSLARAVQYFEKARRLAPDDARVAHNLRYTRARLDLDVVPAPVPYWQRAWDGLARRTSALGWWWSGFLLVLTGTALLACRILSGRPAPWVRRGALASGLVGASLLGSAYALSLGLGAPRQAVLLEEVLVQDSFGGTTPLRTGETVRVMDDAGAQWDVLLPSGAEAAVPAEMLGPI